MTHKTHKTAHSPEEGEGCDSRYTLMPQSPGSRGCLAPLTWTHGVAVAATPLPPPPPRCAPTSSPWITRNLTSLDQVVPAPAR